MQDNGEHGLEHMPPVDHCIVSLILSPDETLTKQKFMMARICSLSVFLLAQSQMLQQKYEGKELGDTNNSALHAFGLMSAELDVHPCHCTASGVACTDA